jgi:hypothetical protein
LCANEDRANKHGNDEWDNDHEIHIAQTLNGRSLRFLEKPMPLVAEIWLS